MDLLRVDVATEPPYAVRIGPGAAALAAAETRRFSACAVVSDATVAPLHLARLGPLAEAPRHLVPPGEGSKSFAELEALLDVLVAAGLDRRSVLVALGGGVVGDLAGLAASLYMRGIAVVQVPTTLLAMVDSSVGGKTAVNLAGGKNLAGTFHQPAAVLADTDVLATLPAEELASGLGEIVKTALLAGEDLLGLLEKRAAELLARDPATLAVVVERCVRAKARVVAADEREAGARKALNLGHTFAHGIEHAAGYGTIPHGVAVATGLALAARFAAETGVLADDSLPNRALALLERLHLPRSLGELRERYSEPLAVDALVAGMRHDKKGAAGEPRLVLPVAPGRVELDVVPAPGALERFLARP